MAEREKSAMYPAATWGECLDFIKTIDSLHFKSVSYQELAKKYGLSNPNTKSFMTRISAAKQFGLLTTIQGNTIQLTNESKKLLYPTGESMRNIELSCFAQPPLYAKLIEKYDGVALPSQELLANILMGEYRITRSVKDAAAKCFFESAEQLGLIQGGILCYSDTQNEEVAVADSTVPSEDVEPHAPALPVPTTAAQAQPLISNESDYITQAIPFTSGKIARFIIPVDASEDDLLLLHDMFDVLLRRKFKINI
ncbi:MAG: hypothetical protein IJ189_04180 [Clostridia bacterium]|nr:hypothetical protein [Clostridia bacterium]